MLSTAGSSEYSDSRQPQSFTNSTGPQQQQSPDPTRAPYHKPNHHGGDSDFAYNFFARHGDYVTLQQWDGPSGLPRTETQRQLKYSFKTLLSKAIDISQYTQHGKLERFALNHKTSRRYILLQPKRSWDATQHQPLQQYTAS